MADSHRSVLKEVYTLSVEMPNPEAQATAARNPINGLK
jgi:hypothetical protein